MVLVHRVISWGFFSETEPSSWAGNTVNLKYCYRLLNPLEEEAASNKKHPVISGDSTQGDFLGFLQ